jgi:tetratricopeptide (TPR) repeat protein
MSETVGFIGLGLMGRPMAKNILKKGYPLVVHSRSQGPVDELVAAGARKAASPADVARQATRIITMVPDSPDVELVLDGPNGVFSALQPGTIIIDMSSIAPGPARRLAERAKALALQRNSSPLLAASKNLLCLVNLTTGKLEEAATFAEDSLRLSREVGIEILETYNLIWLALGKSWQGKFTASVELSEQGLAVAKAHNLAVGLLWILWGRGFNFGGQGEYDKALASLQEMLEWSERFGDQITKCLGHA